MSSLVIIMGYLLGSITSAIVVCKLMGLSDPRQEGSSNPGTTNVLRLHGKKAAGLTLLGDVLKGVLPVLFAKLIDAQATIVALTGLAAFMGHLYPVFFNFRGGKGVATLVGILFATSWMVGFAYITTWLTIAFLFRYSSLAALTAAVLTPAYTWLLLPELSYIICFSFMAGFLIWRHRGNIKSLLAGTEGKLGKKKA